MLHGKHTDHIRIQDALPAANGVLPDLSRLVGLPDFEWAARQFMNAANYSYFRLGAASEWSYRNNLEIYQKYRFRPRVMVDITGIESTMRYVNFRIYFCLMLTTL